MVVAVLALVVMLLLHYYVEPCLTFTLHLTYLRAIKKPKGKATVFGTLITSDHLLVANDL